MRKWTRPPLTGMTGSSVGFAMRTASAGLGVMPGRHGMAIFMLGTARWSHGTSRRVLSWWRGPRKTIGSYIDPVRRLCSYCALSIARRYWRPDEGEDGKVYCDPAHVPAWATYPLSQFTAHGIGEVFAGNADAPGGAGASRDGWSGVRTGSATGREGEPIDDGLIIGVRARRAQTRLDPRLGPFVLRKPEAPRGNT
jgi:hypothetical protein